MLELSEYHLLLIRVLSVYCILSGIRILAYPGYRNPWPEVLTAWVAIFTLTGVFLLPFFVEDAFMPSLLSLVIPGIALAVYDLKVFDRQQTPHTTYLWVKLILGILMAMGALVL